MKNPFDVAQKNGTLAIAQEAIARVVTDSFDAHPMRHLTRAEVSRRTDICLRWVRKLCGSGMALDRAIHQLRNALSAELDGRKFEPGSTGLFAVDERIDDVAERIVVQERRVALAN